MARRKGKRDLNELLTEIGEIGDANELVQQMERYQAYVQSCQSEIKEYSRFIGEYEMLIGACEARYETLTKKGKKHER